MKKHLLILIAAILIAASGIYLYAQYSFSADDFPYPDPKTCQESYLRQMAIMYKDWTDHLDALLAQPKPASDLVDDAFDSYRTYRCWLQYLCHTVRLSGEMTETQMADLRTEYAQSNNIFTYLFARDVPGMPVIPGCVPVEDIKIPSVKLGYIEKCASPKEEGTATQKGLGDYEKCMQAYSVYFQKDDESAKGAKDETYTPSVALMTLEQRLKKAAGDKKTTIIGKKLEEIMEGMGSLETSVNTMGDLIQKLDARITCYPKKCD